LVEEVSSIFLLSRLDRGVLLQSSSPWGGLIKEFFFTFLVEEA
jgi:hypothetical protein